MEIDDPGRRTNLQP